MPSAMASKVIVFELQNDKSVKVKKVYPTFPGKNKDRLYFVTTQNSDLHLLYDARDMQSTEKNLKHNKGFEEKSFFQYGGSTKVFAVTDPTLVKWEVRLLLSPSEFSRLSSFFNLNGFVNVCLTSKVHRESLASLGVKRQMNPNAADDICTAAAQFLCLSDDHVAGSDYTDDLRRILTEKLKVSCIDKSERGSLVGALAALAAAELAASAGGSQNFDYRDDGKESQEDHREQIQQINQVFDVKAELLTVSHQDQRVHVLFRNPNPDNWASGGERHTELGEKLMFGMCHKVLSISGTESEIQFLQSLQESSDLVSVFHVPGFVEHLLKVSEWRKNIRALLKEENQKAIINELSRLAVRFVCGEACQREVFRKWFRKGMQEKMSSVGSMSAGGEAISAFGILVAVLAALTAKSIADGLKEPISDSEDENTEETQAVAVDTTSVSDVPEADVSPVSSSTSDASNPSSSKITYTTASAEINNTVSDDISSLNTPSNDESTPEVSNADTQEIKGGNTSMVSTGGIVEVTNLHPLPAGEDGGKLRRVVDSPGSDVQQNLEQGSVDLQKIEVGTPTTNSDKTTDISTQEVNFDALNTGESSADSDLVSNVDIMQTERVRVQEPEISSSTTSQTADVMKVDPLIENSHDLPTMVGPLADSCKSTTDISPIEDCDNERPEPNIVDSDVARKDGYPDDSRSSDAMKEIRLVYPNDPSEEIATPIHGPQVHDDTPLEGVMGGGANQTIRADDSAAKHMTSKETSDSLKGSSASPQRIENPRDVGFDKKEERPADVDRNTVETSSRSSGFNTYWFLGIVLLIILTMVLKIYELLPSLQSAITIIVVILALIFWASRRP
ncbi:uncharacterized protein LOC142109431 isoform X2 [Mixophyes fleayi]|uniref:uncharacterized protein LOC142109431 isoform X2 n=1 Tax=Mixophyes fleayi TaxID=3061075 RepID=UPI003F4E16B3